MIIINSADYVISEFRNEFGSIPPCFLPLGNKKLLSYQIQALRQYYPDEQNIIVSLPQKYVLSIDERNLIEQLNIQAIFVPEGITLGMALLYVLNTAGFASNDTLRLLHGDTLLGTMPNEKDCIALARTQDDYAWEQANHSDKPLVWCGFFAFSSIRHFVRQLATTQGSFTKAVHAYADEFAQNMTYPEINDWYDLGHINTYFHSRSAITTQRAFNALKIANGIVWKSGTPARKIEAEANWFQQLPASLKRFTPQFIQAGLTEEGQPFYETEYLPILPLNELFVHGKNPPSFWEKILGLLSNYMHESRQLFPKNQPDECEKVYQDSLALYGEKTHERLQQYAQQSGLNLHTPTRYDGVDLPSVHEIAQECIERSFRLPEIPAVLHGDLCFSNIMYDSRSNTIKVIDPRGLNFKQEFSIYGNQTYDLAKLSHSIIGLYDFIIADSFGLEKSPEKGMKLTFNLDQRLHDIQNIFMQKNMLPEIEMSHILAPTILLFLSMIPLHFDKPHRQEAMLANALRLYLLMCSYQNHHDLQKRLKNDFKN